MHILIIEDEPAIRQELKQLLENSLYQVTAAEDFTDVSSLVLSLQPDLVLLDLNLPGESGFSICSKVRSVSDIPVILLTGRTDSMDELSGILKGADDYITKPFHLPILLARIAAVLKRCRKPDVKNQLFLNHKDVTLDLAKGCIRYQNQMADLSRNELKILHCLFLHKGTIVSRLDLIEYLWDNQVFIDDNTLSVNITRIRNKLEQIHLFNFIETRRGMGYRI